MSTTTGSPTDVIVRLAASLLLDGHAHPVAAAVARAARMHVLAAPEAFAERLGIDAFTLHRAEAGLVAFDRLPVAYLAFVDGIDLAIDLVSLRELAAAVDGSPAPAADESGPGAVVVAFPGAVFESESVA
ncbi:MAG: hypothetical protein AAGA90_00220 [Actinomycetota bacterium]